MSYIRPNIDQMHGYVPGEQPQVPGLIKLNTNENPYPPAPAVLAAIRSAVDGRLRLYPDPTASGLRQKLAARYGFAADQFIAGNGCDDILNLCVRAFCGEGDRLAYCQPSYSLYPVLAEIQGAKTVAIPLDEDFQIGKLPKLGDVRLALITQPNAPSGVFLRKPDVQRLIEAVNGVVVIDEAYVDFAGENCLDFVREYDNVIVARTLSKAVSFAGMRVGWAVGPIALIAALHKVRDSYNVNRLSQVGAEAALDNWAYYEANVRQVCGTRDRVTAALVKRGFVVLPSQTNFIFAKPPAPVTAKRWFDGLRERKVLVRWWDAARIRDFARVSIGTDEEMNSFLEATYETLR
ncbi:MAG: Histidinol-phosphate aminotransferase [Verrucomicrobiae bacterium]|nr:Histidinol-phosphate aminotransferase [Verrucomicrobiae bacterium]